MIHALRGRRSTRHSTVPAPASDRHGDTCRVLPASPMFTFRSPGTWVAVVRLTCLEMMLLGSVTERDAHVGTAFAPARASGCLCRCCACESVCVRSRLLGRGTGGILGWLRGGLRCAVHAGCQLARPHREPPCRISPGGYRRGNLVLEPEVAWTRLSVRVTWGLRQPPRQRRAFRFLKWWAGAPEETH